MAATLGTAKGGMDKEKFLPLGSHPIFPNPAVNSKKYMILALFFLPGSFFLYKLS